MARWTETRFNTDECHYQVTDEVCDDYPGVIRRTSWSDYDGESVVFLKKNDAGRLTRVDNPEK